MSSEQTKKPLMLIVGGSFAAGGGFFFLIGLLVLGFGFFTQNANQAVQDWPTVEGTLQFTKVDEREARDDEGSTWTEYHPRCAYLFQVGGKEYQGTQFWPNFQTVFSDKEEVDEFLAEFPDGKRVQVYYNPENPERCALIIEDSSIAGNILLILGGAFAIFGLLFAGVGGFVFVKGIRERQA